MVSNFNIESSNSFALEDLGCRLIHSMEKHTLNPSSLYHISDELVSTLLDPSPCQPNLSALKTQIQEEKKTQNKRGKRKNKTKKRNRKRQNDMIMWVVGR